MRTVLFDLDGTLLDSIRLILDSYHHTLAVHGFPPRTDAFWLKGIGTPMMVQFAEWADRPALLDEMIGTYRVYNIANHDAQVRAYEGAVEAVRALKAAGIRVGLVTSKNSIGAARGLKFLGIQDAMEVVITVDDVTHPKPHPEPVLVALERLGASASDCLYVGDSIHDMECGRAAGVRTGAALWGPFMREELAPSTPDFWFRHPSEIVRLVAQ